MTLSNACKDGEDLSVKQLDPSIDEADLYLKDYESPNEKWGYLDTLGNIKIKAKFDHAREFSEGLAAVNFNGKWGYIAQSGDWEIPPAFRSAYSFSNGIARVQTLDKKYGFIEPNGNFVLDPIYEEIYDFNSGLARLKNGPIYQFLKLSGDTLKTPILHLADDFRNGWARIKESKYGFIDSMGKIMIEPKYDRLYYPSDDMIRFKAADKFGFLNISGTEKIAPNFKMATDFHEGTALVTEDSLSFLIDKRGKKLLIRDKRGISYAGDGLWKVIDKGGNYGLMNSKTEMISECTFQLINNFFEGIAVYQKDDFWGYLNTKGVEITPPIFPLCWDFKEGKARVITRGGVGYINKKGKLIIPGNYFENRDFSEGLARVQIF